MSANEKVTRTLTGKVVSDKMNKTLTVLVERSVRHPLYKKYLRRSTRFHVHDEAGEGRLGDTVTIEQCRPLSKTKAWRLVRVVARSA